MRINIQIIVALIVTANAMGWTPPSNPGFQLPEDRDCVFIITACTAACETGSDRLQVLFDSAGTGKPCPTEPADCTPGDGQCGVHCAAWSDPIVGSIASHNIECHAGKSLDECQQLCDINPNCLSLDVRNSDGHCCLGTCRIGDGCENDDDTAWTYYECVPHTAPKPLACGDRLEGSTVGLPHQFGQSSGDSIYEFVAADTSYTFDGCLTTDYDLYLSIYDSNNDRLAYNDDHSASCPSGSSILASHLVADNLELDATYYLVVEGFSSNEGSYVVDVSCPSGSESESRSTNGGINAHGYGSLDDIMGPSRRLLNRKK